MNITPSMLGRCGSLIIIPIFFASLCSWAANDCRYPHGNPAPSKPTIAVPKKLALVQVGYLNVANGFASAAATSHWFYSQYSFDLNRWSFADRWLDRRELTDLYSTAQYSPRIMAFTYDAFASRGLRKTGIDREAFLKILEKEDRSASEEMTTYFGFQIDHKVVATAKTTIVPPGFAKQLPLCQKLPVAAEYIEKNFTDQTLVEIGRLAKVKEIHLETVFSTISHHLLQRGSDSGMVLGHAAKAQASIYEKAGFTIILKEDSLGPDQMVVAMPIQDFIEKFPPMENSVVSPATGMFLDEPYYYSDTRRRH